MNSRLRPRPTRLFKLAPALLAAVALTGCAVVSAPTASATPGGLTGNWQFQTGSSITSPPTGGYLVGALQVQGSQVTGAFTGLAGPCTAPLDNITGSYDSSTGNLTFNAIGIQAQLLVPADPTSLATGTLVAGGYLCQIITAPIPSVGVEIAPLTGTYTGTLTESLTDINQTTPVISTGTAALTLTQSSMPNSSGAFPISGTLAFPANSGFGAYALSGTIAGEGITLQYLPVANPVAGPAIAFTGSTNPAAAQITVSNLDFSDAGAGNTNAVFTGTLTLQ